MIFQIIRWCDPPLNASHLMASAPSGLCGLNQKWILGWIAWTVDQRSRNANCHHHNDFWVKSENQVHWIVNGCKTFATPLAFHQPDHMLVSSPPGIKPHDSAPLMLMLTNGENPKNHLNPLCLLDVVSRWVLDLPRGFHQSSFNLRRSPWF